MVSGLLEELVEEGNSLEIFFFSAPTLLPENVKGFFCCLQKYVHLLEIALLKLSQNRKDLNDVTAAPFLVFFSGLVF